jgi:peptidyl-prolyl cis-trans isomerase C
VTAATQKRVGRTTRALHKTTAFAFGLGLIAGVALVAPHVAFAQDAVIAKVNGKAITEADLKLADAEIGSELGQVPEANRRQLLLEFMIETLVFADAAETAKLGSGPVFDAKMAFLKRRALRDMYYEQSIKGAIKDADAKAYYDEQVKAIKPQEEVNASHILVEKKELADEIAAKLKKGGDFAALSKEHSKDPGSKENGGSLGFFGRGQMVPPFEEAVFKLAKKGDLSEPVQSQFGWHIIRLDDKRTKSAPPFESVKERIVNALVGQKAQTLATDLRAKATVDVVDPELKKALEAMRAAPEPAKKP